MTKRKKHQVLPSGSKRGLIVAAVVGIWCLLWVFGIQQHSYYFVRCGGQLPISYTRDPFPKFGGIWKEGYLAPSDFRYYSPPYVWTTTFYCTDLDALNDRVSPSPMSESYKLHKNDAKLK